MLEKCTIIDFALKLEEDVLFVDADIIFFNKIENISIENKDIGISKHEILDEDEVKFGKYNGGFIYVKNKSFTTWWKEECKHSSFYEQKAMDDIPSNFSTFFFPPQNNFGWWRLCQTVDPQAIANQFEIRDDIILYQGEPLNSIHTHLDGTYHYTVIFNRFIGELISKTNNINYSKLITNM